MQSRPSFSEYRHSRSQSSFGVEAQCRPQLAKQRLRVFQIARVEPFRKPGHRSKQFARLLRLPLVTPETRKLEDQSSLAVRHPSYLERIPLCRSSRMSARS